MFRTFCEAMDQEPAMTLTMLEDLGHIDTRHSKLRRAAARIRNDIEMYGDFSLQDALQSCDLDQLTDAEIKYLEERLNHE
jgi:hypothetical protein